MVFLNKALIHKSFLGVLLLAPFILGVTADAQARVLRRENDVKQIPSWYFSVTGALNYVDDSALNQSGLNGLGSGDSSFDNQVGLSGAIGYRPRYTNSFWDNTRFEVEVGMAQNDADEITIGGTNFIDTGEEIKSDRIMVNTYLDVNTGTQFRPYVGVGAGIARLTFFDDEDEVFAYQAMTGVTYTPASFPIVEFGLGYRYFNAEDAEVNSTVDNPLSFDYESHGVEATFRAYF